MILQELLDRAEQAVVGVAGAPAPQVDREITAYTVYPHAVRAVYRAQARTGRHLDNLTRAFPIEIVRGAGKLPDEIFREYLDRSFLPREQFASWVPFEDYNRYRYDNQMVYYATRNNDLVYSGGTPRLLAAPSLAFTASAGSITITGDASAGAVGDRFFLTDPTNGLICDAIIDTINAPTNFTIRGKTLAATTGPRTGAIYDSQDDVVVRSVTDLVTSTASATATSATAAWTSKDAGRRLRVFKTGTSTVVIDAIIKTVTNATDIVLSAKPITTETACDASVMYSPLLLQTVGIPVLPTDICDALDLAPEVAEDVIMKIAAVLRGELKLQSLIEVANV